jgi:hypothetical protein
MHQMIDNTPDNRPCAKLLDAAWADQAVKDTLAGILLNAKLVKAGLWHKLLCDMTSDFELEAYSTFIISLRDSQALARNLELIGLEYENQKRNSR